MSQQGGSRVFYSPNKTALGSAGDCTSIIVRGGGQKQILRVLFSYLDPQFNLAAGLQNTLVYGRVVVLAGEFRCDNFFAAGAANAPTAATDFTQFGDAPIMDMVTNTSSGTLDFTSNEIANEGRVLSQGDGPLTVILCAAQVPASAQIAFSPRLHVLWKNVYDDPISETYRKANR